MESLQAMKVARRGAAGGDAVGAVSARPKSRTETYYTHDRLNIFYIWNSFCTLYIVISCMIGRSTND